MSTNSSEAQRAWFLGPRAENAELMERLIVEALRDHSFWRRNYHPEDGVVIRESDKRSEGYLEATSVLSQEFSALLAKLKQDLPFFSGRYLGHMLYEQTLAAQVGYFAAMLYNPNNVAAETSPATTAMELEVASELAKMVGYVPDRSWGHLTSGGTLANFEAIWIARNTHYLPLAVAGAARELGVLLEARLPDGTRAPLSTLDLWQSLNLDPAAALDLLETFSAQVPAAEARAALDANSLSTVGTRTTRCGWGRTTAIPSPPRWYSSPRQPTTPGRRSSGPSASAGSSFGSCRSTRTAGWTPTRSGTDWSRARRAGRRCSHW